VYLTASDSSCESKLKKARRNYQEMARSRFGLEVGQDKPVGPMVGVDRSGQTRGRQKEWDCRTRTAAAAHAAAGDRRHQL
jgi:hypothetical protein